MRPQLERSYLEREDIQAALMVKAWLVWKRCLGWEEDEARRYTKQAIWRAAADIKAAIRRQAYGPVGVDVPLENLPEPAGGDTVAQYEAADSLRVLMDNLEPEEWALLAKAALWRSKTPPPQERRGLSRAMWYYRVDRARQKISDVL
jgi:hypothetical protein